MVAEAMGVASASSAALFRPIRVLILDFRADPCPSVRSACRSRHNGSAPSRYRDRPRKLTSEQEAAIRALAGTKSLRSLAAEFGVSHETVRAVLARSNDPDFPVLTVD